MLTTPTFAFVCRPNAREVNRRNLSEKTPSTSFVYNEPSSIRNPIKKVSSVCYMSSVLEETKELTVGGEKSEERRCVDKDDIATLPSYLDDGFVFGLDGSGLSREKGRVAQVVVEGDSLETKPYQFAFVGTTLITHLLFASSSIMEIMTQFNNGNMVLGLTQSSLILFSSWLLADLGSGILHWSVDNYGNGRTPIMGGIIAAFQGHHTAPWTITQREFCNNVHKLCIPFGIPTISLISLLNSPFVTLFFATFCTLEIMSQEFHKWSHQRKSEVPGWVNSLMKLGLVISRQDHSCHHMVPFKDNYCIVSGFCNDFLDNSGFFRMLEHQIYKINGVESNAMKINPTLRERTINGDYAPVRSL